MDPRSIPLTRGFVATVDATDFDWLMQWRWFFCPKRAATGGGYAYRSARIGGRMRTILMHRVIVEAPEGVPVDHRNGDGLDNRRSNLRFCTPGENRRNSDSTSASGFKGVYRQDGRFKAEIWLDGRTRYLGRFDTPELAAAAYDRAAGKHLGEFARLNFPEAA